MRLRYEPIHIYCLHHVSREYDALRMWQCDWMPADEFMAQIHALRTNGYEFISLTEAYHHLQHDSFRQRNYAVLTFDDGYASIKEMLPWLMENKIPVTLFVNGQYLDGTSYSGINREQALRAKDGDESSLLNEMVHGLYLTRDELFRMDNPLIEIGSHGWEHTDATQMNMEDFRLSMEKNIALLREHPRYIPFHAYTWGRHNSASDQVLREMGITPLLVDGVKNYNQTDFIHREIL